MPGMNDRWRSAMAGFPLFEPGHVWLAGSGPGDPGMLTLHALAGLAEADVVVHDALVDPRVLALAHPGAILEFAGKRGGMAEARPLVRVNTRDCATSGSVSSRFSAAAAAAKAGTPGVSV